MHARSIVRRSLALAAVVAGALVGPSPAHACSCAGSETPRDALSHADAVFEGRALRSDHAGEFDVTRFSVLRAWKGASPGQIVGIATDREPTACGVGFKASERYLVYAYVADGHLTTDSCTRTRSSEGADEDLAILNDAVSPQPVAKRSACAACAVGARHDPDGAPLVPAMLLALALRRMVPRLSSCISVVHR